MDDDAEVGKGLIGWSHRIKQKRAHRGAQAKFDVDFERPNHELECFWKNAPRSFKVACWVTKMLER